jgi:hypothetical protein
MQQASVAAMETIIEAGETREYAHGIRHTLQCSRHPTNKHDGNLLHCPELNALALALAIPAFTIRDIINIERTIL